MESLLMRGRYNNKSTTQHLRNYLTSRAQSHGIPCRFTIEQIFDNRRVMQGSEMINQRSMVFVGE